MRTANRIVVMTAGILFASEVPTASADYAIPESCTTDPRPVAVIDCMHTQIELLTLAVEHRELLVRLSQTTVQETPPAPQPVTDEVEGTGATTERAAWFDEHLQVYAISGIGNDRVAHATLDGREYRLRAGDAIRLAKVLEITDTGIELGISDTISVIIGLGARKQATADQ